MANPTVPSPSKNLLIAAGAVLILLFAAAVLVLPGWLESRNQIQVTVVGDGSAFAWTELVSNPPDGGIPYEIRHQSLGALIQSEDFRIAGIQYAADIKQEFLVPGVLDHFDVVMLYNATVCDRTVRQVLADFVEKGGQLVVFGDACTRVVDSSQTGWSIGNNRFGEMMPAVFQGVQDVDVKLKIYAIDHPIFNGIKNSQVNGYVSLVKPSANATVLAFLNSSDVESGNALYGILEKPFGKGRVVYFAYDPFPGILLGGSRNLLMNLLLYLDKK
ncbi:hypothetical protein HY994_00015 [Candidatus Micrarchaeota archaeon]|nr:hypothetical protein [Candidatus Micrarchaeota archaeon]